MDSKDNILLCQDPQFGPTSSGKSGTSPVRLDDSPPLPPNNPISDKKSVKKAARGVNFSPEEDKLLISAWLSCSLEVQGTDQKHPQLWEKISKYFQQYKETTTERSVKSLINRWSFIQKATNKFSANLAQLEELNQSGMTEQDKFEKAKIMYQSLEKCNFQFEHCWHLLKGQPKCSLRTTKGDVKQWKKMFPSPTPITTHSPVLIDDSVFDLETKNVIENEGIELGPPMGRKPKKGKRNACRQAEEIIRLKRMKYNLLEESYAQKREFYLLKAKKMEYYKEKEEKELHLEHERLKLEADKWRIEAEKEQNKIRQEDERLRLEFEKLEIAKKESEHRIMMMDVSVMSEMQRLYFEELQREFIMRRNHACDKEL